MESTGVKNKIQVSEATAKLLIAAGYDRWLTPREDVVHAKGKGDLRTFFVTNNEGSIATFSHPTHQFSSTDAPALMGSTSEDGEMQDLSEAVQKRLVGMQALPKERV